jgi:hypothetical protein
MAHDLGRLQRDEKQTNALNALTAYAIQDAALSRQQII